MTTSLLGLRGRPFNLLYADPPWRFEVRDRESGLGKSADRHYRTMSTDALARLPVREIAARDAILVMWVYDPMLPDALRLADAWGFRFVTVEFRWFKLRYGNFHFGTGYHTRGGGCEEAWLFKRGRGLPVLDHTVRREFFAERREHSRKPDEVRDWLLDLYGPVPRVELFARQRTPGWRAWGDDLR